MEKFVILLLLGCYFVGVQGQIGVTPCTAATATNCPNFLTNSFCNLGTLKCECPSGYVVAASTTQCDYECGALTDPVNGAVDTTGGTVTGDVATYTCVSTYKVVGSATRTCVQDTGWDSTAPTCAAAEIGDPCNTNIFQCANIANGICQAFSTCECSAGYEDDGTGLACTDINECLATPCENGGTCANGINMYTCTCVAGYAGTDCETNINECSPNPCDNGGTCTDGINSYTCACVAGYNGDDCENNINECDPSPCQNGAACLDGINTYLCSCVAGYAGTNCETNIDECSPNPCKNGATCIDGINQYTCDCVDGYDGTTCNNNINECLNNDCQNGATCVDGIFQYTCTCVNGYTGEHCGTNIDECATHACQNGATCVDGIATYECVCANGYTGTFCGTNIDECATAPCTNGGTCVDAIDDFSCNCVAGYTDKTCATNIDDCAIAPCQNGGTCVDDINDYSCICLNGYTEKNCQTNIDECVPDPCTNGGTCVDAINDFTCNCVAGYTDETCTTNIDECSPNPCKNGATCIDGINQYTCDCVDGYDGTTCNNNINECLNNDCQNGATCVDGIFQYTCTCVNGYTGEHCGTNIDECVTNACQNGATCVDLIASYECVCANGYTGTFCGDIAECPADTDYMNTEWARGTPGNFSKHTCPKGSQGTVIRYCNNDGVYQDPVYNCTRSTISDIFYDIKYNNDSVNVSAALDKLANVSMTSISNETLFIGDMNLINDTLSKITDLITINTTNFDHLTGSFVETVNNIIEEKTTPTWKVMLNQTGNGAESVLHNIDRFVEKIVSIKNISVVLPKSNLYLKIGAVKASEKAIAFPDRTNDNVSDWARTRQDQLTIDCSDNTIQSYSGVTYRNLSHIIPSTTNSNVSEVLQLNAPVISFTYFPNTNRKLEKPIQLKFQMFNKNLVNPRCSFWAKSDSNSQGFWSDEGCQQKKDDLAEDTVVCVCNHLTNFAVLMQPSISSTIDEDDATALSYISMVGCIISMICLFLNVVIHVYFWRVIKSVRSIIHINLSCSLFVAYLIFLPGINKTESKGACTAIAVLLHLVFLIVFFVMLTEGCNLAYTVIKPLSTRKPGIPLLISSYVLAVIIVAVSMGAVQMEGYGTKQACWLSTENGLIWAFLVPVLVVILINFIIVTIVIQKMCGMAAMSKKTSKGRAKATLRCILILMPIMGFTWVFGFFALHSHTVMFQYLFAIFNSLQGLLILIFHCVMNKKIRDAFRIQRAKWIQSTTSSGASSEALKMKTQNTTDK